MPSKKNNTRSSAVSKRTGSVSKIVSPGNKIRQASTRKNNTPGITSKRTKQDGAALKIIRPSGATDQSFFELVYEVARQIPYGRVTSYGAIAAVLGTKSSARVVGYAMNGADKINPTVPAHRVVNRVGLLSGKHHFNPPGKMEKLLKKEGVLVKDDIIVNFREKFWDPSEEML